VYFEEAEPEQRVVRWSQSQNSGLIGSGVPVAVRRFNPKISHYYVLMNINKAEKGPFYFNSS
jgi:hypothetical protein